jgi:hypothetical protein
LGVLENGQVEIRVRRPQQSEAFEDRARDGPDEVEFVGELEALPVAELKMLDDAFLPLALLGTHRVGEAGGDRNWKGESLAPGDVRGRGQYGR